MAKVTLGLDFGTESVRALFVDLHGQEIAVAVVKYPHGQLTELLPDGRTKLPPLYALQHPNDWLRSATRAVRSALRKGGLAAADVLGIGVDFTSCTMLPTLQDGTPLCLLPEFASIPLAWPKLWKHHGAHVQTERFNRVATERKESWLSRYGGIIGLEWFFPKVLETAQNAPQVFARSEVWLEAGDWFVWQMVGGPSTDLPRSTCQAGYKALWNRGDGYPSDDFLRAVAPELKNFVANKMPGRFVSPGELAGELQPSVAKAMGLRAGTPVSAAIIDAHAGVPGAGAAGAGTFVMVMGTSSCHMLNAKIDTFVPGVAGVVENGILPGYYGYETGQAAVGDAFDWLRKLVGHRDFKSLAHQAQGIPAGSDDVLCIDWLNGCRTPLMDGHLAGAFTGLRLHHGPGHLYRALLEASAYGVRWIVELLQAQGVPVKDFVATGGLPHHNRLFVQIYADVLGKPITVHPSQQGPALGAAILGALVAGPRATGFRSVESAIRAMAAIPPGMTQNVYRPQKGERSTYDRHYQRYRQLADQLRESS